MQKTSLSLPYFSLFDLRSCSELWKFILGEETVQDAFGYSSYTGYTQSLNPCASVDSLYPCR